MSSEFVYGLMKRIKNEATDEKLFEAAGLGKKEETVAETITRDSVTKLDDKELEKQFERYREMLDNENLSFGTRDVTYYSWLEDEMGKRGLLGETKTEEGKIPNPKDPIPKQIDALREEDEKEPEPSEAPVTDEAPVADAAPVEEPTPEPVATPSVAPKSGNSEIEDLVQNMSAAKEHYEKGNMKVAKELLKLVQDSLKVFKDKIKSEEDMQKSAEAPRPEEGTEDKVKEAKVNEQDYTTIARGISDEDVAKKIAIDRKGVVVKDDTDSKKFMVIMKESFSSSEVTAMIEEARKDANELSKQLSEEAVQQKEEQKKVTEKQEQDIKRGEQMIAETNMMLDILAKLVTGKTSADIKTQFESKKEQYLKDNKLSEGAIAPKDWTSIMSSVIGEYEFARKKDMLESLSGLYGMQQVHIDEKKSQLLDKLLKTDK